MIKNLAFTKQFLNDLHAASSSATPPVGTYADTETPGLLLFIATSGHMAYQYKYKRFGIICVEHLGNFGEISINRAKEYIRGRFMNGQMIGVNI